jgi:hypothetical protein
MTIAAAASRRAARQTAMNYDKNVLYEIIDVIFVAHDW